MRRGIGLLLLGMVVLSAQTFAASTAKNRHTRGSKNNNATTGAFKKSLSVHLEKSLIHSDVSDATHRILESYYKGDSFLQTAVVHLATVMKKMGIRAEDTGKPPEKWARLILKDDAATEELLRSSELTAPVRDLLQLIIHQKRALLRMQDIDALISNALESRNDNARIVTVHKVLTKILEGENLEVSGRFVTKPRETVEALFGAGSIDKEEKELLDRLAQDIEKRPLL